MEKNSNAFDGMQNDEVMKEITCAIISVSFISWFTCAVVGSFGVITNRIRTAIVSSSLCLKPLLTNNCKKISSHSVF